jgi:hypothetical protein
VSSAPHEPNNAAPPAEFAAIRRRALIVAAVGAVVFALMAGITATVSENYGQFFLPYLVGWFFWFLVPMGSMVLLMIQYLTGGKWGVLMRRIFEANTRTFPLMLVLFLPLLLALFMGEHSPYEWVREWASPGSVAQTPQGKEELAERIHLFLNPAAFVGVSAACFVIWGGFIFLLNRWSARTDATGDIGVRRLLIKISGPGLMIYAVSQTFATMHWVMSLEMTWASTMFPVIVAITQILGAYTFSVITLLLLARRGPMSDYVTPGEQIHLGSFMLAFTCFWTYVSFAQFMLVWVANLPEELVWYAKRSREGWQFVAWALGLFHFALPFVLLLYRDLKSNPRFLMRVSLLLLVMCAVDVVWWVEPTYAHHGHPFFWVMDLAAIAAIGGVWVWVFLGQLGSRPLLPARETNVLEHAHG